MFEICRKESTPVFLVTFKDLVNAQIENIGLLGCPKQDTKCTKVPDEDPENHHPTK